MRSPPELAGVNINWCVVLKKSEMRGVLSSHLASYQFRSYESLAKKAERAHVDAVEVKGPSGTTYQVEVLFVWDDNLGVRICGSIDTIPRRPLFGFLPI